MYLGDHDCNMSDLRESGILKGRDTSKATEASLIARGYK
jgi:hypothetical protein